MHDKQFSVTGRVSSSFCSQRNTGMVNSHPYVIPDSHVSKIATNRTVPLNKDILELFQVGNMTSWDRILEFMANCLTSHPTCGDPCSMRSSSFSGFVPPVRHCPPIKPCKTHHLKGIWEIPTPSNSSGVSTGIATWTTRSLRWSRRGSPMQWIFRSWIFAFCFGVQHTL